MSYNYVNVSLTPGQIKKLTSQGSLANGTTITLKPAQMNSGSNKLSLTKTQFNHFNKAKSSGKGVQLKFSKVAVSHMVKTGGFLPLLAVALPALAPILGSLGGFLMDKIIGKGIKKSKKKGRGLRLPGSRFTRYQPQ